MLNLYIELTLLINYRNLKLRWYFKQTNICLKTGRFKGVYKLTNLSRHTMRKLMITNNLQNLKK